MDRFDDTRMEREAIDLKEMNRDEVLRFYNENKTELFKLGPDCEDRDERNGRVIEAYERLAVDGRLTKDISGSDFLRIQEERFERLPKVDLKGLSGESVSERGVSLYQEKMLSCDKSASPALAYGLMRCLDNNEDRQIVDRYAAFSVTAFITTLSPEERAFMLPRTAGESREYIDSPFVDDGRFDKAVRAFTGDVNINMEMMDKLAETTRDISGKEFPTVAVLGDSNGLIGYELERSGVDVVSADRFGSVNNPFFGEADLRYTDVKTLDYAEAAREYGDRDVVVVSAKAYGDSPLSRVAEELRDVNDKAVILYMGPEVDKIDGLREVESDRIKEVEALHVPYPGEDTVIRMYEVDTEGKSA